MNREIKFRAWTGLTIEYNVVVGKFGAFYVNPGKNGDGLSETDSASLTYANTKYPETVPIMQFTGLKDKNGKEIYEGDIVNDCCSKEIRTVVYQTPEFTLDRPRKIGHSFLHGNCEVIGNIYENPELLKK